MSNLYLDHLIANLYENKQNVIRQKGKSDLDSSDYTEKAEDWYAQILEYVHNNPPIQYVKAINIRYDSISKVQGIEYIYCDEGSYAQYVAINIYSE